VIRLIFGCGYLGLRVAKIWAQAGDEVYAVTRNENRKSDLESFGIKPIVADITKPESLTDLPASDTLLFAVGMDRSVYSDIRAVYVDGLKNVLDAVGSTTRHFIYVSSTGVYGDFGGEWIDESSETNPAREGGKACLEAEALLKSSQFKDCSTILRFAGIYGPDRVPTRDRIKNKEWSKLSGDGYLNLIQVDDGANVVTTIADRTPTDDHPQNGETYIVSDGNPSVRREYYEYVAKLLGIEEIPWDRSEVDPKLTRSGSSKRAANKKLLNDFEIAFQFPDYQSGLKHAIDVSQ